MLLVEYQVKIARILLDDNSNILENASPWSRLIAKGLVVARVLVLHGCFLR
jgi:hypothetical protein